MNSLRILTVFFVLVLAGCLAVKAPRSLNDQPLVRLATLDIDGVFASDHSDRRGVTDEAADSAAGAGRDDA